MFPLTFQGYSHRIGREGLEISYNTHEQYEKYILTNGWTVDCLARAKEPRYLRILAWNPKMMLNHLPKPQNTNLNLKECQCESFDSA